MTKEHEITLQNKYPIILDSLFGANGDGIECGDGWFWLIDNTLEMITSLGRASSSLSIQVSQIRELDGVLKIYIPSMYESEDPDNEICVEKIISILHFTQLLSESMCERCGTINKVGKAFDGAFRFTRCYDCWDMDYTLRKLKLVDGNETEIHIRIKPPLIPKFINVDIEVKP